MENKKEAEIKITEENDPDSEVVTKDDVELITPENDPEEVTIIKRDDRKCHTTSEGDKLIASGKNIIKSNPKAKEEGKRSWFDLS